MHFSKRYGDECERARNNSDSHLRCRVSLSICLGYQLITWPPGRPRLDSGPAQNPDQDHLKLSSEPEWTHQWQGSDMMMCRSQSVSLMASPDGDTWRGGLMGLGATEVTVSLSNCPLTTEHAQSAHHSPGGCLVPVPGLWLEIFLSSLTTDSAQPGQCSTRLNCDVFKRLLFESDRVLGISAQLCLTWLPHSKFSKKNSLSRS